MATTTPERRIVGIPSQTELEEALATSFQEFPGLALSIAWNVERLASRDDLELLTEEGGEEFDWPEQPPTFEDIGRIYVWVRRVRSYIAETEDYLAKVETHLDALESFTPEHGDETFRARIAQAERRDIAAGA